MEKITKREMFEALKGLADSGALHMQDFNENISDSAVAEFCANEIEHLDKKAAKAKETAANKKAEGDALTSAIRAVMSTTDFEPIATIAVKVDIEGEEVTASKVQYRLTQLVKNGEAEKQDVEIVDGDNKKRKIKGYRLI